MQWTPRRAHLLWPVRTRVFNFMAQAAGETPPMAKSAIEQLKGRDEILRALKDSYDYGAKVWMGMTDQIAMEMIPGRGGQPQLR